MALPTFVVLGTPAGGTGNIVPALPAGHQTGDLLVLWVQSANEAITAPAGYTEVSASPQGTGTPATAGSVRVALFWKIDSGSESAPTILDTGDHTAGGFVVIRGVNPVSPINAASGGVQAGASSTLTATGLTSTVDDCYVILAAGQGTNQGSNWSAETNTDLSTITERGEDVTGGTVFDSVVIVTAEMPGAAKTIGNTTATTVASQPMAFITIAIAPPSLPSASGAFQ